MSYQSPGPYPGQPQHPQSAGYPANAPYSKPPRPKQVMWAHYCMLAGAALSVLGGALGFAQENAVRNAFQTALPDLDTRQVNDLTTVLVVIGLVLGVVEAALWIWMAFMTKAGRHWARILSAVFFGIGALGASSGGYRFYGFSTVNGQTMSTSTTTVSGLLTAVGCALLGLLAIIFLFSDTARPFFRKPPAYPYHPYAYGYAPGYGQPMGYPQHPGWGQPAAPQQPQPQPQSPPQSPSQSQSQGDTEVDPRAGW